MWHGTPCTNHCTSLSPLPPKPSLEEKHAVILEIDTQDGATPTTVPLNCTFLTKPYSTFPRVSVGHLVLYSSALNINIIAPVGLFSLPALLALMQLLTKAHRRPRQLYSGTHLLSSALLARVTKEQLRFSSLRCLRPSATLIFQKPGGTPLPSIVSHGARRRNATTAREPPIAAPAGEGSIVIITDIPAVVRRL